MKTLLSLLAVSALLCACGGGGSSAPAAVAPAPVAPVADSFTSDVSRVVAAAASEVSDPVALDATAPTISETAEPVPVS